MQIKDTINTDLLKRISTECNMPLTFGGGINSIQKADKAFYCGADKITINSSFFNTPNIVEEVASKYGSQAVVISIDVKKENGEYVVYHNNGTVKSELSLSEAITIAHEMGAGEFLVNDIDNDGMMNGFDIELIKYVRNLVKLPLIFAGGCSSIDDFKIGFNHGVDAVAAASIFHWIGESIITIKQNLDKHDIKVRMI